MITDIIAQFIGGVMGGFLVIYLLCKVIEFALLKRILKNYNAMIFLSSVVIFSTICIAGYIDRNNLHAPGPNLIMICFIAALALPFIRKIVHNRKAKAIAGKFDKSSN